MSALLVQLGIDPKTAEGLIAAALYLTIVTVIAAILTGIIAKRAGRSVTAWVLIALSIPLLPLLIVWLLPARKPK